MSQTFFHDENDYIPLFDLEVVKVEILRNKNNDETELNDV